MIYTNLDQMVDDIRQHTKHGEQVEFYDQPKQLLLGFKCIDCNLSWQIKIHDVKTSIHSPLREKFVSDVSKIDLLNFLNWK